ncbi:uncharacterized protein LOC144712051 isoform X3 [Wolffia australiana]
MVFQIAMDFELEARKEGDEREHHEKCVKEGNDDDEEDEQEEEEEYVFLDLDDIYEDVGLPDNVSYVLADLDTLNPRLIIGDLELIGKYEESIGTCYIFSETEVSSAQPETGPSETNLIKDKSILGPNQFPSRQAKPIAGLHKILKFRRAAEGESKIMADSRNKDKRQEIISG